VTPGEAFHIIGLERPAGWETARKMDLAKLLDMSGTGEYRITLSTAQPTLNMADGEAAHDGRTMTVTSNEITITVVPVAK
jgi:hypothetical protein